MNSLSPIVFHIPHASQSIPSDIRQTILLSDSDLEKELTKITDAYTDELFDSGLTGAQTVVFPVSRLVLDPERFVDDDQEIMAERGMGVIYTRTSDGQLLRHQPNSKDRLALINQYYRPHHQNLESCVSSCLEQFQRCMIIDCHSFPLLPLPYEIDLNPDRPDICIGADDFHTPDWLKDKFVTSFEHLGFNVAVNKPFTGSIVPMQHYKKDSCVMSIMVELNRKLYMNEKTGEKIDQFDGLKEKLSEIVCGIHLLF
jgi:N-formylglutamate deformylase